MPKIHHKLYLSLIFVMNCMVALAESPSPLNQESFLSPEITVLNRGVPGANSSEILANIERLRADQPSHVVIMLGVNDALNSQKRVAVDKFSHNLSQLIERARQFGARSVTLVTNHPVNAQYVAERHPTHSEREKLQSHLQNYNRAIHEIAVRQQVTLVDWNSQIIALSSEQDLASTIADREGSLIRGFVNSGARDGVHLTAEGSRLLAQEIAKEIRPSIQTGDVVVCLGDSITFGVHLDGAGTATGQTYPAELGRALASKTQDGDIVVYGGTSAGITAAIQAARMGKTVILICPKGKLGGMTGSGLGATDIPDFQSIGGLAREFYQRIYSYYLDPAKWDTDIDRETYFNSIRSRVFTGRNEKLKMMWVFEPHVAQAIFEQMAAESGITVLGKERLDLDQGVTLENGAIRSIRMESGCVIRGGMFIDATYEGDLMAKAGVSYVVGREPNSRYGETMNGILPGDLLGANGKSISPYIEATDPASGLLPFIEPQSLGKKGEGDERIQAYCYRLSLTSDPKNRLPIEKPANYNALWFESLGRCLALGSQEKLLTYTPMPNRKTDFNHCDFVGANYDYPEAGYARRAEIEQMHQDYASGRIWFLQHDPRVPREVREAMLKFGWSKDEFIDSGHFPYQLYVREARRMISDYVMIEQDVRGKCVCNDSVGVGSYWFDSHVVSRCIDAEGKVREDGGFWEKRHNYPISYRSIYPRKSECRNLLVPVCLSASHAAYGSIRMEPVYMVLGQSAGTAASLAIDSGVSVQDVSYLSLRKRLLSDGQVLEP